MSAPKSSDPSASLAGLTFWSTAGLGSERASPMPSSAELRCIAVIAAALLSYGLPANRIEESIARLARAFGIKIVVFGLPTATLLSAPDVEPGLFVARAEPGTIDLTRLDALHKLVADIEQGRLAPSGAEQRVTEILQGPRRYPRWLDLPAVMFVAFGGALMLGTSVRDALFAGLLGLAVAILLGVGAVHRSIARVLPTIGTVAITLASCALWHAGLIAHPLVITLAALLVLLPGLTLTLAMTELATGHFVSGGSRTIAAVAIFLQLGFGVLLGLRLGRLEHLALVPIEPASLGPAATGALVLAAGFAVLHVMRARDTFLTLLVSAVAFFTCRVGGAHLGVEIGTLLAATAVGLCGHAFTRYCGRPSSMLTLPGVVMLLPGSLGLLAVSAAAFHDPSRALDVAFEMLMVVIALSTGILIATAALPPRAAL